MSNLTTMMNQASTDIQQTIKFEKLEIEKVYILFQMYKAFI